jgi:hypothetical protein
MRVKEHRRTASFVVFGPTGRRRLMWRRSRMTLVLVFVTFVLLPVTTNLATNSVPERVKPYLWLAWPTTAVLAFLVMLAEVRRMRRPSTQTSKAEATRLSRATDQLAETIYRQWSDEAATRRVHSPQPLRVRWSATTRPVAAHPAAVLGQGAVGGRPLRLRLRGGLTDIVAAFTRLPRRQLVVLGEPGAGKTVLAILLTLGLLEHRQAHGGPVPVLLAPSSWNPYTEHLHTWVAGKLVDDYPALANTHIFGPDVGVRLVTGGHILPVLDGLDEMPISLRAAAIEAVNLATADSPLVVTCRSSEYQAAVTGGGSVLAAAAVIELEPVGVRDVITFLATSAVAGDDRWAGVFTYLRAYPDGPLAAVLSSPLMVALARTVYTDPASDPTELLNFGRFDNRASIEEHLLDAFVPAAYADHPLPPAPNRPIRTAPHYPPRQAHAYLTFLAQHLQQRRTSDLAWWQLHYALAPLP